MVSGSLFSSCSWKIGTTLPVEPEHVAEADRDVRPAGPRAASATSISATRLLAPMTLVGRTALSVDTRTKRSTSSAIAASSSAIVPPTFT